MFGPRLQVPDFTAVDEAENLFKYVSRDIDHLNLVLDTLLEVWREHGIKYRRPAGQNCLMALELLPLAVNGDVGEPANFEDFFQFFVNKSLFGPKNIQSSWQHWLIFYILLRIHLRNLIK